MSFLALLLVALGLSADAFAVALSKGLGMRRLHLRAAVTLALAFGLAQAVMPLLGWLLGAQLEPLVEAFDHWVALVLLAGVGGTMLVGALRGDGHEPAGPAGAAAGASGGRGGATQTLVAPGELLVLAVATSIDALAVGIGLALVDVNIVATVVLIGVVTAVVSFAGVVVGQRAGAQLRRPAEVAGGLILIGIGVKIVLDHTGLLLAG